MTRRILLCALALLALVSTACGRYLTTGVAVVNGTSITQAMLDRALDDDPQTAGLTNAEQRLEAERRVISQLLQEELIRQEGERLKVRKADLDRSYAQIRSGFPSDEQFRQALEQSGISEAQLRFRILIQAVADKALGDVQATEDEIAQAYGSGERFQQIHVRHILFQVTGSGEAAARKKAEAALEQLKAGADFAGLAKQVSEDPGSKAQGGDLGTITRDTPFDQDFLRAAFALKAGKISGLVRTQFGFHIIKVETRTSQTLAQARTQLAQEIIAAKQQRGFEDFFRGRVATARIVVNPRWGDFNPDTLQIEAHEFFVPPSPEPETQQFPVR